MGNRTAWAASGVVALGVAAGLGVLGVRSLPGAASPVASSPVRTAACLHAARADAVARDLPGRASLQAIQFVSPTIGYAVSRHRIYATRDAGRHWRTQQRAGTQVLYGEDILDARDGWVLGSAGLLRTRDGGATWRTVAEPCPLRSVHFYSALDGVAVGGGNLRTGKGAVLLRTSDGGRRWTVTQTAPTDVDSACLTDPHHGYLGAAGQLYRTDDGGVTWQLVSTGLATQRWFRAVVQCVGPDAAWAELDGRGGVMNQSPHLGVRLHGSQATVVFAEQYFPHPGVNVTTSAPGSDPVGFSAIGPGRAAYVDVCPAWGRGTVRLALARSGRHHLDRRGDVTGLTEAAGGSFVSSRQGWVIGTRTGSRESRRVPSTALIVGTTDGGRHWRVQKAITSSPRHRR